LYTVNKYSINPAYAGIYTHPHLFFTYRKIASSISGAPENFGVGLSSVIYKNMSLGGRFYKQSEGLFNTVTGFIDYSYKLKLNNKQNLRFGISAGLNSNKIDYSEIVADNPAAIMEVASKNFEGVYFESAAGIVYNWDRLEVSISVPKLFDSKSNFMLSTNSLFQYTFSVAEKEIDLKPSILISYKHSGPTMYNVNLQAFWRQKFWVGLGYRNRPGIILSAGLSFNKIGISYASELSTEKYANMFNQIHEIGISYSFAKKRSVPNDTLITMPIDLLAEKDSIQTDSFVIIKPLIVEEISQEETDISYIEDEFASKYKIAEVGDGIYMVKPLTSDTFDDDAEDLLQSEVVIPEKDSTLARSLVNPIEKKGESCDYELVEVGPGVFTIKQKSEGVDSINLEQDFDEEMLDSLMQENDLFKQFEEAEERDNDNAYSNSEYYTVQLFIDKSNKHLLTNSLIVDMARIERDNDGQVKYYYGYFSSKEEAERQQKRLSEFDLETKVLKFDAFE